MIDLGRLLRALADHQVDFIVVGGIAAATHGSAKVTYDLDIVYSREPQDIERLVQALAPLNPYLRDAPAGLPFSWDAKTIQSGLNFTLTTAAGALDLLGEVSGGGTFADLLPHTVSFGVFGIQYRCVTLEKLILLKRAAGRPRDLDAIAELEALLEERDRRQP